MARNPKARAVNNDTQKRCPLCKETKPRAEFWKAFGNYDGTHGYCKTCSGKQKRDYYNANGHTIRKKRREYRLANPEKSRATQKRAYIKKRATDNDSFKASARRYMNNKLRTNVGFRLLSAARNRLWYVLKGTAKAGRTIDLLGCTPEELKAYLEKQFQTGWTWANWGSVFEIDHIIPCSKFDMTDPEQQKQCFHYSNLQPLLKEANRSKWNKLVTT